MMCELYMYVHVDRLFSNHILLYPFLVFFSSFFSSSPPFLPPLPALFKPLSLATPPGYCQWPSPLIINMLSLGECGCAHICMRFEVVNNFEILYRYVLHTFTSTVKQGFYFPYVFYCLCTVNRTKLKVRLLYLSLTFELFHSECQIKL